MNTSASSLAMRVDAAPPSTIAAPAAANEFVGALVDSVVEVERMIASFTALRAELIDTARQAAGYPGLTAPVGPNEAGVGAPSGSTDIARRSFRAEIATALRMSERAAESMIAVSEMLTHSLPLTLGALRAGTIGYAHAQRIVDAAALLSDAGTKEQLERVAVPVAERSTPATLTRKLRPLREKLQPETLAERHARALDDREVLMDGAADGMGWLNAYLPIVKVTAIFTRLSDTARSLRKGTETRTLAQLRADILCDVLLDDEVLDDLVHGDELLGSGFPPGASGIAGQGTGGTDAAEKGSSANGGGANEVGVEGLGANEVSEVEGSAPGDSTSGISTSGISTSGESADRGSASGGTVSRYRGIRPRVYVTVPVLTLLGHGTEPATLEGYGPIDPETARELTALAPSFTRILTHPETGAILSVGRSSYVVPSDLRTWLRIRDHTCRFPGCNQRVTSCDVDHSIDWQTNGLTAHDNLAHLCRGHHTLKHHGGWRVKHVGDGTLDWTSPMGRRHRTHPENRLPPGFKPVLGSALGSEPELRGLRSELGPRRGSGLGSQSRGPGVRPVVRPPSASSPSGTTFFDPPPF